MAGTLKMTRTELQRTLEGIPGVRGVYYQPPESVKLKYPAIIYSRSSIGNDHADNAVYRQDISYELVVVEHDPDGAVTEAVSRLPMCRHNRHYVSDGLNHDVFTIVI